MISLLVIIFLSYFLIFHSYVVFPILLKILSKNKKQNELVYSRNDELPEISILLAVYNEEQVIAQKIESTFRTNYPLEKIKFIIGSDASTDNTNNIINEYASKFPIHLELFSGRTGKSGIINRLTEIASTEIYILTDANVFFNEDTLYQLVKHFKNEKIAQVGGNIKNPEFKKDGISFQEKSYLSRENIIKYQEGVLWGAMMGTFGGCYSIRASVYEKVPNNFLVDDFYISMSVLEKGYLCINELDALCEEDVSNKIEEEFRRKVRISTGNFQNLAKFKSLLWPPLNGIAFSFLSHKVIRWIGPVLLMIAFISSIILAVLSNYYLFFVLIQLVLFASPIFDFLLKSIGIHNKLLRFANYFILMNLALFKGLLEYLQGVQSSIWEPTQRNQ